MIKALKQYSYIKVYPLAGQSIRTI